MLWNTAHVAVDVIMYIFWKKPKGKSLYIKAFIEQKFVTCDKVFINLDTNTGYKNCMDKTSLISGDIRFGICI